MPYEKILVAFDGSQGSWQALRKALGLASEEESRVVALSIEEHLPRYAATVGEVDEEKARENSYFHGVQSQAMAREHGVDLQTETVVGHAAQTILEYARQYHFDLIVMGRSGHSGIWGLLLGSTTDRVVEHAPCDVLVVH